MSGSACNCQGDPLPCQNCHEQHGVGGCNFSFSDEIANDRAVELRRYVNMSSVGEFLVQPLVDFPLN